LANLNLDASFITAFFKLNRGLPPAGQSRISSLYVLDAICRGLQNQKEKGERTKSKLAGKALERLEAVVESWVDGMVGDGKGGVWSEGKVGQSSHPADTRCSPAATVVYMKVTFRRKHAKLSIYGRTARHFPRTPSTA
jgi:hypothetical protein